MLRIAERAIITAAKRASQPTRAGLLTSDSMDAVRSARAVESVEGATQKQVDYTGLPKVC